MTGLKVNRRKLLTAGAVTGLAGRIWIANAVQTGAGSWGGHGICLSISGYASAIFG